MKIIPRNSPCIGFKFFNVLNRTIYEIIREGEDYLGKPCWFLIYKDRSNTYPLSISKDSLKNNLNNKIYKRV